MLPDPLAAGWNGAPICELLHEDSDHRKAREHPTDLGLRQPQVLAQVETVEGKEEAEASEGEEPDPGDCDQAGALHAWRSGVQCALGPFE